MKILHVLDHSIPLHSGYTFRTLSILKQQHVLGLETCHVTSPKHGNPQTCTEDVDGLLFYRSGPARGLLSKLPGLNQLAIIGPMKQRILQAIEAENPDVVHAHSPALNGIAAYLAAKQAGLPFVYEIRAFWEDAAVDHGTCKEDDLRYRATRAMESWVVKKADAVTTICEGLKQDLLKRGVAADKITTIPNAVNIEQFNLIHGRDTQLEQEFSLQGKIVLGFLGSFYAYEGLDMIIKALPEILNHIPNAMLLLVGGGPQEQNLKTLIEDMGLQEYVIMPGRVPHQEVTRYYSQVDLLLYPRKPMRLTELVTPLKPLEAMAQGRLVLASDVGGHKELITDGQNGWLFDSGSVTDLAAKTVEVLSHKNAWPDVINNGRVFVEEVRNWRNSVLNYLPLYEKLVTKSG
jgi:PEP-CTERM/exosortase A-associated glycosyltransferase